MSSAQDTTEKYGGIVTTVDPSQGILQVATKTASNISVTTAVTNTIWRWPEVGDQVMIRQENGSWMLDGWFLDTTADMTLQDAAPGDVVIASPTGVVHVVGSTDGSTDFRITKAGLPPEGPAGGDLAGTYPNPTLAPVPASGIWLGLTNLARSGTFWAGKQTIPGGGPMGSAYWVNDATMGWCMQAPIAGLYRVTHSMRIDYAGDGTEFTYVQAQGAINSTPSPEYGYDLRSLAANSATNEIPYTCLQFTGYVTLAVGDRWGVQWIVGPENVNVGEAIGFHAIEFVSH